MDKLWEHVTAEHKEEADTSMKMPKEEQDKMMEEAKARIKDM